MFIMLCVLPMLVLLSAPVWANSTVPAPFRVASMAPLTYTPDRPLWDKDNWEKSPSVVPLIKGDSKPLKTPFQLKGNMLRAPNSRKDTLPNNSTDPMDYFTEQRLLGSYGTDGWQQMAIDGQLRFAQRSQLQSNKGVLAPYVMGGMGVTEFTNIGGGTGAAGADSSTASDIENAAGALGLRYGAGIAYTLGDELDLTAGYRVNRMEERAGLGLAAERLNMEMLDFGLRYRY